MKAGQQDGRCLTELLVWGAICPCCVPQSWCCVPGSVPCCGLAAGPGVKHHHAVVRCSCCLFCGIVEVKNKVGRGGIARCGWYRESSCINFVFCGAGSSGWEFQTEKQTSQFCANLQASLEKTALIAVCCPGSYWTQHFSVYWVSFFVLCLAVLLFCTPSGW